MSYPTSDVIFVFLSNYLEISSSKSGKNPVSLPSVYLQSIFSGRAGTATLKNRFFGRKFHSKNLKND